MTPAQQQQQMMINNIRLEQFQHGQNQFNYDNATSDMMYRTKCIDVINTYSPDETDQNKQTIYRDCVKLINPPPLREATPMETSIFVFCVAFYLAALLSILAAVICSTFKMFKP
jgi:hypothetical protein